MTAYELYVGIGMVCIILKSRILSHGLEAQNYQEVVEILTNLIFVLHIIIRINQEINTKNNEAMV